MNWENGSTALAIACVALGAYFLIRLLKERQGADRSRESNDLGGGYSGWGDDGSFGAGE